ncbi:MAG: PEP-CTERM sorting domain-containing protein [Gammaproteobacteria bacterium]|nr:PEP-CTERM sorting domain-containing protein [Gammaproteobacteria bacterium]
MTGILAYINVGTPPTNVPEPSSLGLMALGLIVLGMLRRRLRG